MDKLEQAELIADGIIGNLRERKGLGDSWDEIDEELQGDIRSELVGIALAVLTHHSAA